MNDATHTDRHDEESSMDKETAQTAINKAWAAMNAASAEDKDAARAAYNAALAAYPSDDEKSQAELDAEDAQYKRETAERQALEADRAARDEETHRRIMDGSLDRETAELDASKAKVERAMDCGGNY